MTLFDPQKAQVKVSSPTGNDVRAPQFWHSISVRGSPQPWAARSMVSTVNSNSWAPFPTTDFCGGS
jgi:hypothetical protein